jgi:hypothetical protein
MNRDLETIVLHRSDLEESAATDLQGAHIGERWSGNLNRQ